MSDKQLTQDQRYQINDFTLRLGEGHSVQPFPDKISVHNRTGEKLEVTESFYGRNERFLIFDLGPDAKVEPKPGQKLLGV